MSEDELRARRLLGHNLRRLRAEAGLTQRALGELIGATNGRVSEYESGSYGCTIDMLQRMATAFDVSIADLFDETGFDEPTKRRKKR